MLKGTLDDFTLPDVFRLMSFAKKTGCVDVVRSAGQGKVYFRAGEVYFASSSLSKEPLGQKLVRSRALTEGQLMKALDEQASSKERLGSLLLKSGLVTEEQLESAVRQQIEDAVFDLLRWELGEFEWAPGVELDTEVHIGVSVENLIMEASRRLDEYEVIKRKIPSGQAILGMAATPPEGAVEINITPEEWRILVLVDGHRSVEDIAGMVGLDEFGAMRVLYGLVSAGLIELVSEGAPAAVPVYEPVAEVLVEESTPQPDAEPVAELEPVAEAPAFEPEAEAVSEAIVEPEPVAEAQPEPEPEPVMQAEPVAVTEPEATEVPDQFEPEPLTSEPVSLGGDPFFTEPVADDVAADLLASWSDAPAEPLESQEPVAAASEGPSDSIIMDETDLESFGIGPLQSVPDDDSTGKSAEDAAWTEVAGFDAPQADELVTSTPEASAPEIDPFVSDLFAEPSVPHEPPAPPEAPAEVEIPVSSAPAGEEPAVDRAAVVRELAGLFSDDDRPRARPSMAPPSEGGPDDERKRVEDDDQVTKGIISRLIDGVKGL